MGPSVLCAAMGMPSLASVWRATVRNLHQETENRQDNAVDVVASTHATKSAKALNNLGAGLKPNGNARSMYVLPFHRMPRRW